MPNEPIREPVVPAAGFLRRVGASRRGRRAAALALAAALAAPAAAYIPPASAILKRVAQRRDDLGLAAMQVQGTLVLAGEAARRATAAGLSGAGPELAVPATISLKAPGRCRLELAPPGAGAADRPAVSVRAGRRSARRGLDALPAAPALVEALCALLAERGGGDSERALAQALTARGVALGDVAFGRLGGRVAYVLGGRPQGAAPQAWIDKLTFQPVRLVARFGDAARDVRLVDFGSPVGGEGFPRAVEVWDGTQLEARFTAEKVASNPRLPDSLF